MTLNEQPLRVAINGYGLVGRCLATRLQHETFAELVAINDPVLPTKDEQSLLGPSIHWSAIADPAQLPWRDLAVDVVIEASSLFARPELEVQVVTSTARILMTGDLREGLPDLTLVPNINGHQLSPDHRVLCAGSDRSQCLLPLFCCLDSAFGLEQANVLLIRPPYVGRAWGMRFADVERQKASMQFDRVQAGLGSRIHLARIEDPTATTARFHIEVQLQTAPTDDELRSVLTLESFRGRPVQQVAATLADPTICRIDPDFQLRRKQGWLSGEYAPITGYVERLLDCLELLV